MVFTFSECSVVLLVLAVAAGGGGGQGHEVTNGDQQGSTAHDQGDQAVGGGVDGHQCQQS